MHPPLRLEGLFCLLNLYKYYFDILFHGFEQKTSKMRHQLLPHNYCLKVLQKQIQENYSYQENLT